MPLRSIHVAMESNSSEVQLDGILKEMLSRHAVLNGVKESQLARLITDICEHHHLEAKREIKPLGLGLAPLVGRGIPLNSLAPIAGKTLNELKPPGMKPAELKPIQDVNSLVKPLQKDVKPVQDVKPLQGVKPLQDVKPLQEDVINPKVSAIDGNKDLNKASDTEIQKAKALMSQGFKENVIQKGDPGFMYDVKKDFGEPTAKSDWDSDDDDIKPTKAQEKVPVKLPIKIEAVKAEKVESKPSWLSNAPPLTQPQKPVPTPKKEIENDDYDFDGDLDDVLNDLDEDELDKTQTMTLDDEPKPKKVTIAEIPKQSDPKKELTPLKKEVQSDQKELAPLKKELAPLNAVKPPTKSFLSDLAPLTKPPQMKPVESVSIKSMEPIQPPIQSKPIESTQSKPMEPTRIKEPIKKVEPVFQKADELTSSEPSPVKTESLISPNDSKPDYKWSEPVDDDDIEEDIIEDFEVEEDQGESLPAPTPIRSLPTPQTSPIKTLTPLTPFKPVPEHNYDDDFEAGHTNSDASEDIVFSDDGLSFDESKKEDDDFF